MAPNAAKCGNVEADMGGVVVGDGGMVAGIEAVAENDFDVCRFCGEGDLAASAEATGPEVVEHLVQGLGRLQSVWAIQQWWSSVVEAMEARESRKAREARERGEARVRVAGVSTLVHGMWRWQLPCLVLRWRQWRQVVSVLTKVAMVRRGRIMSDELRVWKGQARVAKQRVTEEARLLGLAVKRMSYRKEESCMGQLGWGSSGTG